ncbi:Pre-rRNA-processing protein ipi3 [Entomortierella beljakovae]|nr:Pre-rRNA-processing protein ipi3 [Entomortierella beljakovae]
MFVELALTSSSDATDGTAYIWNLHTGSMLGSFKQNISPLQSMALVNNPRNLGGLFLSAQADKGMMHVYNFQKDQVYMKFPLPDKIICLAVSNRGVYCAGGTENGRIHIWEIATGILHRTFDAHYKKISVIRFSADDTVMFTGSEDAVVHVWMLNSLLDDSQTESPAPHYSWTDHTLPITDIQCGVGRFHGSRVITSSLDHTCKLWDLSTGTILTTFLFPTKIVALAFDPSERYFLAASGTPATTAATANEADYLIYQALLYKAKHTQQGYTTLESVDGDSGLEQIGLGGAKKTGSRGGDLVFRGHHNPITRLALNFDGSALVSGDSKGHILVWDVASRQMVRDIKQHKVLTEKPKLAPITAFKRIPQSRIGEGGPEFNSNSSIADDPQIVIAPSTTNITGIVGTEYQQFLQGVYRSLANNSTADNTSTIGGYNSGQSNDYLGLQRKYQELEARLATMTAPVVPSAPVVSSVDVSAALSGLRSIIDEFATTERKKYPEILKFPTKGKQGEVEEDEELCDIKIFPDELLDQLAIDNQKFFLFYQREDPLTKHTQKLDYWVHCNRTFNERYPEHPPRVGTYSSTIKYLIIKNHMTPLLALAQSKSTYPINDLYYLGSGFCFGWNRAIEYALEAYIYFNILGEFPELCKDLGYKKLDSCADLCFHLTNTCGFDSQTAMHIPFILPPLNERVKLPKCNVIYSGIDLYRDIFQDMGQLKEYLKLCFEVLYRSEMLARECGRKILWEYDISRALRRLHVESFTVDLPSDDSEHKLKIIYGKEKNWMNN